MRLTLVLRGVIVSSSCSMTRHVHATSPLGTGHSQLKALLSETAACSAQFKPQNERNASMTSTIRTRLRCLLPLIAALAGTVSRADAQSGSSTWRFGVSVGGGALVGAVAEYWSDDIGVEARLGTLAFRDMSVRLSPKWRVGDWDGGEASLRLAMQWWWFAGSRSGVFAALHGVELAKVTDGGQLIGGSYNLPLFGGFWGEREVPEDSDEVPDEDTEALDEGLEEDTEAPDEPPEEDAEESDGPSSWTIGAAVSGVLTFFFGEFTYRYESQSDG